MTPFTVATLEAPGGSKAAIGIEGSYYLLEANKLSEMNG
jgi:hypothetical protein